MTVHKQAHEHFEVDLTIAPICCLSSEHFCTFAQVATIYEIRQR